MSAVAAAVALIQRGASASAVLAGAVELRVLLSESEALSPLVEEVAASGVVPRLVGLLAPGAAAHELQARPTLKSNQASRTACGLCRPESWARRRAIVRSLSPADRMRVGSAAARAAPCASAGAVPSR
jgi:hypothetical protein